MKKTKEEILDKYLYFDQYDEEYIRYSDSLEAMEEYSNQQLEDQWKKIEKLIIIYDKGIKVIENRHPDKWKLLTHLEKEKCHARLSCYRSIINQLNEILEKGKK